MSQRDVKQLFEDSDTSQKVSHETFECHVKFAISASFSLAAVMYRPKTGSMPIGDRSIQRTKEGMRKIKKKEEDEKEKEEDRCVLRWA